MTINGKLGTAAAIACGVLLSFAAPGMAQKVGPNGGMTSDKDGQVTELVVGPGELTIYLMEDGKPQSTKDIRLRAVIQEGGKNATLDFRPADGNRLVARLQAPVPKGSIIVISGKDDHGHPIAARFVIN